MARRDQGDGTIYQRADGRWCARLSLGVKNGKRVRKDFYGKTRREVQTKLKQFLKDQQAGLLVVNEKITVDEYLQQWLEEIVEKKNKPSTYRSYADTVRLYIVPAVGDMKLSVLAPAHVQRLLNDLHSSGLAARTVAYVRSILRTALNQALKWGYVVRNAAALAESPRQEKHMITPLTASQVRQLLFSVEGHRLASLYHLALGLGLRRGELLNLRWADVDLAGQTLRVTVGKTRASARVLPLSAPLVASLQAHWERQQAERLALGVDWKEHGFIFPSEVGTAIPGRNLLRHFKASLKKAGLPQTIRFHDLRHTCATFLIAQGTHARVVMEVLGHSQIGTTMNIYGHVASDTQKTALSGLDSFFTDD